MDNAKLYKPQKMKYFLVIDQGTSSTRAILFDEKFAVVNVSQTEFKQFFPKDGWVEHDANEIFDTVIGCIKDVMTKSKTTYKEIIAIGITNQRETCLLWDKEGNPLGKAIVWQDRRTAFICEELKSHTSDFYEKTGLVLDAYFSGTKIKWILDENPELRQAAERGELAFGTVDSWLIWNLTDGTTHTTDVTNASRTLLFNIHTLE